MARYCANCGTEVDDTAVFCPTCGQPIDQATEAAMPPAPAWPDETDHEPDDRRAAAEPPPVAGHEARSEEPTRLEEPPPPAPLRRPPSPAGMRDARRARPPVKLPVTMPVTLSAWLIGVGAVVAAVGVLIGLFTGFLNPIDLVLLVGVIGVAVTVFFSGSVPPMAQLRLVTLVIVLVGFGIALDRIGFGVAGAGELLLILGTAAAAIGAILLELGHDQPLGGPAG